MWYVSRHSSYVGKLSLAKHDIKSHEQHTSFMFIVRLAFHFPRIANLNAYFMGGEVVEASPNKVVKAIFENK